VIEILDAKLEAIVSFNSQELEILDFKSELIANDFSKMAEGAMLLDEKLKPLNQTTMAYKSTLEDTVTAYNNGEIGFSKFITRLNDNIPNLISSMSDLLTLDQEMMEYYGNTFDTLSEKFSDYLT
jgi:hypothetical protein